MHPKILLRHHSSAQIVQNLTENLTLHREFVLEMGNLYSFTNEYQESCKSVGPPPKALRQPPCAGALRRHPVVAEPLRAQSCADRKDTADSEAGGGVVAPIRRLFWEARSAGHGSAPLPSARLCNPASAPAVLDRLGHRLAGLSPTDSDTIIPV